MSHRVLIVDDEPSICWALEKAMRGEGYQSSIAASAEEGFELATTNKYSIVILDVRLPGLDGLSALPKFHTLTDGAPIIVTTAFGDLNTAVSAVRSGASDYLTKPFKLDELLHTCRRAVATRGKAATAEQGGAAENQTLIGQSAAMQQVFKQIALVADSELPVLIMGETGTGKELVAAAIATHSAGRSEPFIAVSPVALNSDLLESELFGHVRGAFTGAIEDRKGYFERAAGGTLLLDEIGELPLSLQVKLLRVLEQREFTRVGDHQPIAANFRIIAATNQDLRDAVQRGEFREDLYHRLAGMLIYLPSLRERDGDVPQLCSYFLRKLARDRKVDLTLSEDFVADLNKRPWHGNVRELRNACEHAVIIARGRQLTIDDFPKSQPGRSVSSESTVPSPSKVVQRWASEQLGNEAIRGKLHSEFLADFESQLFKAVLAFTNGNRVQAAQWLGLNRATLRERLKNYANNAQDS